jgi:hypothetical protein
MMLADFGADVIKIESAEDGDGFRNYPPYLGDESVPYLWANRGKRSVGLDLKSAAGREIALQLAASADIVIENFSTGVMQRLGLDYEAVRARNPEVIYCSVSSYGRHGPFANRIGFDPVVQAKFAGQTLHTCSTHPDGMGLVQKKDRPVTLLQLHDLPQRSQIAVHAEDRLGDDHDTAFGMLFPGPLEMGGKLFQIVVGEDAERRTAHPGSVNEAGMGEFIQDDHIPLADQGGDGSRGRGSPRREDQGRLASLRRRKLLLKGGMFRSRPADQP